MLICSHCVIPCGERELVSDDCNSTAVSTRWALRRRFLSGQIGVLTIGMCLSYLIMASCWGQLGWILEFVIWVALISGSGPASFYVYKC